MVVYDSVAAPSVAESARAFLSADLWDSPRGDQPLVVLPVASLTSPVTLHVINGGPTDAAFPRGATPVEARTWLAHSYPGARGVLWASGILYAPNRVRARVEFLYTETFEGGRVIQVELDQAEGIWRVASVKELELGDKAVR